MIQPDKIEHSDQPLDLKTIDIGQILPDLNTYNKQFGIGMMMFNVLISRIPSDEIREKTPNLTVKDIQRRHATVFRNTGLSLEPVRGSVTMYGDPDGEKTTSEMRLNISDGNKFVGYLNALSQESITPSQIDGLKTVAEILTTQLVYQYRLGDGSDERMMELFSHINGVISRYKDLDPTSENGLNQSIVRLSEYWEIARKKYLREQLTVEHAGLQDPGEHRFGPASWHKDMSNEFYIQRWENAIQIARMVKQNPNAQGLYEKTIIVLGESLRIAQKDLLARLSGEGEYAGKYQELNQGKYDLEHLAVVEENLKIVEEIEGQLSPTEK